MLALQYELGKRALIYSWRGTRSCRHDEAKKAPGLDDMPIEIFQAWDTALNSLVDLLINVGDSESRPTDIDSRRNVDDAQKGTKEWHRQRNDFMPPATRIQGSIAVSYCVELCLM